MCRFLFFSISKLTYPRLLNLDTVVIETMTIFPLRRRERANSAFDVSPRKF